MVLTDTGLAKVFQRIKSFVLAQLNSKASAVHTHTSSDITDLSNGYVNLSTAQTIGGQKTFSASPRVTRIFPDIALNISDCDVTETPTEAKYASLYFRDKNNKNLAYIVGQQRVDGTKRMCIRTHRTNDIDAYYSVDLDSNGNFYPEQNNAINLGSPSYQWNNAYIKSLTINGVACGDILTHNVSEFVNLSSDQTVGGIKTFSNGLFASKSGDGDLALLEDSSINSSNEDENGMPLTGHTNVLKIKGSQYNVIPCALTGALFTSGNTCAALRVYKYKDTSKRAEVQILYTYANDIAVAQFISCHITTTGNGQYDIGSSGRTWNNCYLANAPIIVSDTRAKTQTQDVDDKLLDAWANVEIKTYKMISAVEKKGEKARYHTGYLAQDIQAECEKQGVNASDYGLFCYDEWEEQEEVSEEVETEKDGKIVKEKRVIQPRREKGNKYSLRYEEALVVECKYLRRCIARLTARIEELEKGNNTK